MLLIQVLVVSFAVFTMTRVLRQFHRHGIRLGECMAWTAFGRRREFWCWCRA